MNDILERLYSLLCRINLPSTDNGKEFIKRERYEAIKKELESAQNYQIWHDQGLSLIYAHKLNPILRMHQSNPPRILITSHIDALYTQFFQKKERQKYWLGTFDNVITNIVIIDLMLQNELPPEIIVAFTGNEEHNSIGAVETYEFIKDKDNNIDLVMVLDVTDEHFESADITIENYYNRYAKGNKLHFSTIEEFQTYLESMLPSGKIYYIPFGDAAEDESFIFVDNDINCFTMCLPTAPHCSNQRKDWYEWMHSDKGIEINTESLLAYRNTLSHICKQIIHSIQWK